MNRASFNQGWQFLPGTPDITHFRRVQDAEWQAIDLPHDWSIGLPRAADNPCGAAGGFFTMGSGWYRKTFTVPESWRGKKVFIEFEGVYMNAHVHFNDSLLVRHPYGYTSFLVDLTPQLKIGEENQLFVIVDNTHQVNSRWYSGSGIYRPTWLILAEPVHIDHWGIGITASEISPSSATERVTTRVLNETDAEVVASLSWKTIDPGRASQAPRTTSLTIPASGDALAEVELSVSNPQLWSVDTPALYTLETSLLLDGKLVDAESTTFGIRTIEFDAELGFRLNGQPIKLKGGCVHHDNGVLGAASYPRSEERKVELHKASGFNAIRCAHNPPAPAFLDACDRLGMLVIDETFDCWRIGKNIGDYHTVFDDWWQRDQDSMVLRDRNHPCVIMWSIGNEVLERDGRSGGEMIARTLADRIHALDPTRPVTSAVCGIWDSLRKWEDTDVVYASLDVGGYNYLWHQYPLDHERHPQRMMVGTESFPIQAFENWMSVIDHPYVLGDFVWTSLDYLGESGIGRVIFPEGVLDPKDFSLGEYPWHQANCGDLDLCGFKRPQSYYRDMLWGVGKPLYIAVHPAAPAGKTPFPTLWGWLDVEASWTWPGREGQEVKVDVYSACEQVELFVNGKSQGIQPTGREQKFMATYEVEYNPGELKVIGFKSGKMVAEHVVQTVSPAASIRLTPDRPVLRAEAGDLCYVTVEIVDDQGRLHPRADRPIYFTLKGPGTLLAVGSADPTSTELYAGNMRSAFRGRALAVVKASGEPGQIQLRAQADGLDGAELVIEVK